MSPFRAARGSLRMRVMLIPATILLLGMLAAIAATLFVARTRISSETASGVGMANLLIGFALDEIANDRNPEAALLRLRRELANVRHVRMRYRPDPALLARPAAEIKETPRWFQALFEPPHIAASYPLVISGVPRGDLILWTWPADEVAEIWGDLIFLIILLGAVATAIVALLYSSAHFALKPLHDLEQGLDRLERGRFQALAEIRVAELRRIGERFNRLAASLASTEAQNHQLVDRLLSVQEAERKELAHELHDEYGAALFGIRAAASCILETLGTGSVPAAAAEEIGDRARAASRLADSIQKQNYRILDRIRPVVLHRMGLAEALRHLTETWRATHRDIGCVLDIPAALPEPSEEANLACYRIIQECLTNIARHAQAKQAFVLVDHKKDQNGGSLGIRIRVEDDGRGLPENFRSGFGLLGMNERARKFGGHLTVTRRLPAGTCVEALIPCSQSPETESWAQPQREPIPLTETGAAS
jgi:two-component system, NarL family, sensor histidine kinase UhpB